MDSRILFGVGVSVFSLFVRWRVPTISKPIGTAGAVFGVGLVVWSFYLDVPSLYAVVTIVASGLIAAAIDYFLGRSALVTATDVPTTPASISIDQSVSSHSQSGGITARNVINQAPEPKLIVGECQLVSNREGTNTFVFPLEIVSPYPPAVLNLEIVGEGITDIDILPMTIGTAQFGHQGYRDAFAFSSIINPFGCYRLTVQKRGEPPDIKHSF